MMRIQHSNEKIKPQWFVVCHDFLSVNGLDTIENKTIDPDSQCVMKPSKA